MTQKTMNVPLLDLQAQYRTIKSEIDRAVAEVFSTQWFIMGPKVTECEEKISAYSRAAHGIGVSSGTDALLIALMAEGIGPGDEVILPTYTFFSTAGSVARIGATPVFVDIDPITFNLDPAEVEAKVTSKTRAIIPVHLYGQMAPMKEIMAIAQRHSLTVIEDAAQAIGAENGGKRAGSIGHYGCFSFFPSKNLGGAGDGGMVVTNDPERAEALTILRNHGSKVKYYHNRVGGNFRLDALQAVVVLAKLPHLDTWSDKRRVNALRYAELFEEAGLLREGLVTLPEKVTDRHVYNQFVIRVPRRDALRDHLKERGVGHEVYYPLPLHLQTCFADLGYREGDLPESEKAARESLALPIYPELSDEQQEYVVAQIAAFLLGR